jgi:multimeric flavodoxin WrbA
MMKILILMGSPRPMGNTAKMAEWLADAAKERDIETEMVYLNVLSIKPCQACGVCQMPGMGECILEDDMKDVYKKIEESDCIIFASPVYFFNLTAQIKIAIDRLYAFGPDYKKSFDGKKFGLLMSYGDDNLEVSGGKNAVASFNDMAAYLGVENLGVVHCQGYEPGELERNKDVKAECEAMAAKI